MDDLLFGLGVGGIGLGLVFGLLGLLWLLLSIIGRLDAALVAREAASAAAGADAGPSLGPPRLTAVRGGTEADVGPELLAAIAVAVSAHAALLRRQAAPAQRTTQPGSQIFASRWLAAGRTRQTGPYSRGR